ncbi:MAG: hypothetical protein OXI03_07470 [Chloroflexota bacterium]|nr:hypothetical protein [Chloroflexota bacterium]
MPIEYEKSNVVLGAGRFFIDRLLASGDTFVPSRVEKYIGDTVGATLGATVERTTIFSGDGAVASKLIDKVTQIDRTIGITPQDASLDNMALFLIASQPETMTPGDLAENVLLPIENVTERDYFSVTATADAPQGVVKVKFKTGKSAIDPTAFKSKAGSANAAAISGWAASDFEFDVDSGRLRFTKAGIVKLKAINSATHVELKLSMDLEKSTQTFERVAVDSQARQVRVAVRYVEDADEGVEGRNIYIPRASVSPAGEAALKSRDTPQQFALTLAIEEPDGGLAQVYVDGVPA